jgi:GNAT superfamily N-acetyltransferase
MSAATIRPAQPADVDELAETAIAAWQVGFKGIVPERVDPSRAWRPERIEERLRGDDFGSEIIAAELDGRVRGMLMLGPSRDPAARPGEGELVALYVHPDHWRQGIGRLLVEAGLERLRALGHVEAIVWTLAESPRNLEFYESLGFARDGGRQRRPSFGSPLELRFRMRL